MVDIGISINCRLRVQKLSDSSHQIMFFLFQSQTYFADVAAMLHVFNAALKGREDSIKNIGYIWQPKLNIYYVAMVKP